VNALRRALDAAAALAAVGVVLAALATEGARPAPLAAALFTLLLFAAENSQIRLPSSTTYMATIESPITRSRFDSVLARGAISGPRNPRRLIRYVTRYEDRTAS